jgi:hypothetical protein
MPTAVDRTKAPPASSRASAQSERLLRSRGYKRLDVLLGRFAAVRGTRSCGRNPPEAEARLPIELMEAAQPPVERSRPACPPGNPTVNGVLQKFSRENERRAEVHAAGRGALSAFRQRP